MHTPRQSSYAVICRILHYLKDTPKWGLLLIIKKRKKEKKKKRKKKRGLLLILYLWHDLVMVIGMIVILIDNPPLTIITLLEIILLFSIVKGRMLLLSAKLWLILFLQILWVQSLICTLGIDVPTTMLSMHMHCDNQATIFNNDPIFHKCTKYIKKVRQCHWVTRLLKLVWIAWKLNNITQFSWSII